MYLRKTRPRATCLYSAASMWPRILSAACHSFSSKPRLAPLLFCFFRATSHLPCLPPQETPAPPRRQRPGGAPPPPWSQELLDRPVELPPVHRLLPPFAHRLFA